MKLILYKFKYWGLAFISRNSEPIGHNVHSGHRFTLSSLCIYPLIIYLHNHLINCFIHHLIVVVDIFIIVTRQQQLSAKGEVRYEECHFHSFFELQEQHDQMHQFI